ncbi:hypothetical protein [Mucilaginibacter sp. SJ]|uniref:hypothetical protein n=1 Tax=Mucilaginibacter sp. SJ TaxID=3029053 RepID=UPI0023A9F7A6|nr:hypothetical protein [Mucilaginibacter sp. SJ]WEA03652.1 hypothetical protein MusilaSJ_11955 [Mucilaginibacter sp. SJ]
MNRYAALIISLVFILYFDHSSAQDWLKTAEAKAAKRDTKIYHLTSIDGKNQTVKIVPDYANHVLKMICLKDIITIDDFWGVPPEIKLLNKSFIEIKYAVRGGSNLGLGNTLILCVNNTHLYEAMHVLRYINSEAQDEREHYKENYTIIFTMKNNKLKAYVHHDVNSKRSPETSYVYDNESVLAFDTKQNVFYSVKENLYDHFTTAKNKTKQKVAGNFPMIILGKETYYFINGRWYTGGLSKDMFEFQ